MFLHFFLLAAFHKNESIFDNSTNGTSFTAPGLSNNFPYSFDNPTKDVSSMTKLFQNSSFTMKRSVDEAKESVTGVKNLSHIVEELTSTRPAKLNGTATATEKIAISFFDIAMAKEIQDLVDNKESKTTKDNLTHKISESTTTSHIKSQETITSGRKIARNVFGTAVTKDSGELTVEKGSETTKGNISSNTTELFPDSTKTQEATNSGRKIARNVFDTAVIKDSGELTVEKGSETAKGNISSNSTELFPDSRKPQEETGAAHRIPKNVMFDYAIFKDIARFVGDKENESSKDMANEVSKMDDKEVTSSPPSLAAM